MIRTALTIAGSDPSGGAGLQADLKTFHQHGVYGMAVVTLLTVQSTRGVARVVPMDPALVIDQLDYLLEDISPHAAKTGALGNGEVIAAVAKRLSDVPFPLVVDPVMISKHGARLMDEEAVAVFREQVLPVTYLVTPNLAEASVLAGIEISSEAAMHEAARLIAKLGPRNVLIKGGHLAGAPNDLLFADGETELFRGERIVSNSLHGSGCVLSSAITALLARGVDLSEAIRRAKQFVSAAIRTAAPLGGGVGPTNMFASVDEP